MRRRLRIAVHGTVQGVGFRPFVYRAARRHALDGWVLNGTDGVHIEVEGEPPALDAFLHTLAAEPPGHARLDGVDVHEVEPTARRGFRIRQSTEHRPAGRASLPPDLRVCDACLEEIATPAARRHRYPFTNCTACGPRWTILDALPYDRARTAMRDFCMCDACAAEYGHPADRRFHAQPIACPQCGPQLRLLDARGGALGAGEAALGAALEALRAGRIVAMRALGGFQLLCDATDGAAVQRLRQRKQRPDKPLAVLYPDLDSLRAHALVRAAEAAALQSPEAPILLLRRRPAAEAGPAVASLAEAVAPDNPYVGAMLPCTPLHALVAAGCGRPLVCTSGNVTGEPMCTDTEEALARLGSVADLFLTHDRPVRRPVDDSVARLGSSGLEVLRRARGWVPRPLALRRAGPVTLALGGHLKSTVALRLGAQVILSQHLGDQDGVAARRLLARTADELPRLYDVRPAVVACDLHPDYASTALAETLARRWEARLVRVQHHHAHIAAAMAEHGLEGRVLGLAWDGTGWGPDATIWGGEALVCEAARFERAAHLRPFALPGGERAVREPRRAALGLLHALGDPERTRALARAWFTPGDLAVLERMLDRGVSAPRTTSMGRLFDAVAALAGVRTRTSFEGQAAMQLEFAIDGLDFDSAGAYPLPLGPGSPAVLDWEPLVVALLEDGARGVPLGVRSARFHAALIAAGVAVAQRAGLPRVVLGGGCFQNAVLLEGLRRGLASAGFEVFAPCQVPPHDGGLALGQALVAGAGAEPRRAAADGRREHVLGHSR